MLVFKDLEVNKPLIESNLNDPDFAGSWILRPENDGDKTTKDKISEDVLITGQRGRTFDLNVHIKEFRERPVIEFFANIINDDTTRQELAKPIIAAINPETIKAARESAQTSLTELKINLSKLIDEAEKAKRDYEQALPGFDKDNKKDVWQSKQRAANLKAKEAGVNIPYPDAGYFRTSPDNS